MGTFLSNMLTPENILKIKHSCDVRSLKKQADELNQLALVKAATPPNIKVTPARSSVPVIVKDIEKKGKPGRKRKFNKPFFVQCIDCKKWRKVEEEEVKRQGWNEDFVCKLLNQERLRCKKKEDKVKPKRRTSKLIKKNNEGLQKRRRIQPATPRQKSSLVGVKRAKKA